MEILIFVVIVLFFFGYPTLGIFQRKITMKRVTVYLDKTPMTFWCSVGMMYGFGVALPCIMLKLPFAEMCMPALMVFIIVYLVIYFLKW